MRTALVPIMCAGQTILAGDVIVADDDGLQAGEIGLDIYGMREKLAAKGLVYRDTAEG